MAFTQQWLRGKWDDLIGFGADAAILDDFELKGVYFLKPIGLRTTGRKRVITSYKGSDLNRLKSC